MGSSLQFLLLKFGIKSPIRAFKFGKHLRWTKVGTIEFTYKYLSLSLLFSVINNDRHVWHYNPFIETPKKGAIFEKRYWVDTGTKGGGQLQIPGGP